MEFNATFIVAFLSFVVFILIMNWILYSPIDEIVKKRQKLIDDNYNEAKTNVLKSENLLKEREERLTEAKETSRQKTLKAVEEINSVKTEKLQNAKNEAKIEFEENSKLQNEEKQKAKEVLKNEVTNLAQIISDKILKNSEKIENVDAEFIENLIQG